MSLVPGRVDKQGNLVSPSTLTYYDWAIVPFLRWVQGEGLRMHGVSWASANVDGRTARTAAWEFADLEAGYPVG